MSYSGKDSTPSSQIEEDYFNIDDILATQQKIPCKFEVQVFNLGFLDPGSDMQHLPSGTKMELPQWLAKNLCTRRKHIVSVELPKQYRESYRQILKADPSVVDLHKLGPHYYRFGTHLLHFGYTECLDIAKSLLQAFQFRLRNIMDSSQNTYNQDTTKLTEKLDETEREIFQYGQLGLKDFMRWETRKTEKLTTSEMVINHRKRKRAIMEAVS